MRYWIYWNEMVQGPFEADELANLHAFSEELPVCAENAQDWIPACRIADLAPAVELWRSRRRAPAMPPPPPPSAPPATHTLQGEFFIEAPGQQSLFDGKEDGGPKGPFAFKPVDDDRPYNGHEPPPYTMPIRFIAPNTTVGTIAVETKQAPRKVSSPTLSSDDDEVTLETLFVPEQAWPDESVAEISEPPVSEPPELMMPSVDMPAPGRPAPDVEAAPKTHEIPFISKTRLPRRKSEPVPEPPVPSEFTAPPADAVIETPRETSEPSVEEIEDDRRDSSVQDADLTYSESGTVSSPLPSFDLPSLEAPERSDDKSSLWPWLGGVAVLLTIGVAVLYWWMDRATSTSAITEALRRRPAPVMIEKPMGPVTAPLVKATTSTIAIPAVIRHGPKAVVASTRNSKVVSSVKHVLKAVAKPIVKSASKSPVFAKVTSPVKAAAPAVELKPTVETKSEGAVLPGLAVVPKPEPKAVVVPKTEEPKSTPAPDVWASRQNDAIAMVMNTKILGGKQTVGAQAKAMLESMHEKELMHAAESGERLYLPDKSAWTALRQDGSIYRVYLNFSALQANGERTQSRSYQFVVDLRNKKVTTDDTASDQDFLHASALASATHPPMAADIDTLLGGIDTLNKHKLRAIMAKKSRNSTKQERKNIETTVAAAQQKIQKAIVYFRTKYPEKALRNVAKAYEFTAVLDEKVKG